MPANPLRPAFSCLLMASVALLSWPATGQTERGDCTEDAMLVFDASGSMASMGYNGLDMPRIVEARDALHRALPDITPYRRLGLIIYGPGPNDGCANIDLRLRPTADAAGRIIAEVDRVMPDGDTPLTAAVSAAAETLLSEERPGVIVLVTDGRETCGGATCELAANLAQDKNITVHVVGFKVRAEFFQWQAQGAFGDETVPAVARCLSDRTGGLYVSAETIDELVQALQQTLGCPAISEARGNRNSKL